MLITPMDLLILCVALTGGVVGGHMLLRARQRKLLRRLAGRWSMHYSPHDRFGLPGRLAASWPMPGVCSVHVQDLVHRLEPTHHRCICTVSFTSGVLFGRRRERWVVGLMEARLGPQARGASGPGQPDSGPIPRLPGCLLVAAESDGELPTRYQQAMEMLQRSAAEPSADSD